MDSCYGQREHSLRPAVHGSPSDWCVAPSLGGTEPVRHNARPKIVPAAASYSASSARGAPRPRSPKSLCQRPLAPGFASIGVAAAPALRSSAIGVMLVETSPLQVLVIVAASRHSTLGAYAREFDFVLCPRSLLYCAP